MSFQRTQPTNGTDLSMNMKLNNETKYIQYNKVCLTKFEFFLLCNRSSLKIYKIGIIDYYQDNNLCSHSVKMLLRLRKYFVLIVFRKKEREIHSIILLIIFDLLYKRNIS